MKTPLLFVEIPFTRVEDELGSLTLSPSQTQNVRNLIVKIVNEKVNMPADTPDFLLKQEYSRGQLEILQFLLTASEEAGETMRQMQGFAPDNSDT